MGLTWQSQHRKLMEHPVLGQGVIELMIPSNGGPQAMTALPLSRLNFWLATIQPNKVPDPAIRVKVIAYQNECADVLFSH
ncbi:phage antirepressor N-terminal domain-containing protein, partial [Salmonella enterica]|uniref:phage antirepressor N-terminal domain-containing protein n=1 Tax=Salmonella enterica TaxID=28901 RepID=UPI003D2BC1BF